MTHRLFGGNGVPGLFGTSGIRGVVNRDHYPDFYLQMALVLGTVLKGRKIAMAADGRVTMPIVKNAMLSGFAATGHEVVDTGILPTPALQYFCKKNRLPGVMITASHNPAEYNGIKLIMEDGLDTYREEHKLIEHLHFKHSTGLNVAKRRSVIAYAPWRQAGTVVNETGGRDLYVNGIVGLVDREKIKGAKLRVLFDCVNGSTTQTAPFLIKGLGITAVPLNEKLDGTFPSHPPEPTEANIKDTIKKVRESDVDFAIVFDSDGDRSIFLSPDGEYIDGNYSVPMIAREKLKRGDSIVMPVDTADTLQLTADEMGLKVYTTKIGRQNVVKEMLKRKAKLGGEENGGIIYAPHQYCGDGGMALALFSEAVASHGIDELMDSMPKIYFVRDKVASDLDLSTVRRLMLKYKHGETDESDGLKMRLGGKRWIMVRRSGTEPVYRIYAQAESKEGAKELLATYKRELFQK